MNIFIATIGTRGDVQPHVALGEGLSRAGHAVTVCTSTRYASLVTERGLGYGHLSDDLVALAETSRGRDAIAGASGAIGGIPALLDVIQQSLQIQRDLFRDGWAAAQEADPDLIVYHSKMAIALQYAERLGVPAAMASLFPLFLPTSAYPHPGFPRFQFGSWLTAAYNRVTHRVALAVVSAACRWMFASWRKTHHLPPQPCGTGVMHRDDGRRVPILNPWSEHVVPTPADRPRDGVETTGYWFLERPEDWTPPAELEAFLAEGPPPVYVGFGSMAGRRPERTTRTVLDALERAGLRGILAGGWGGDLSLGTCLSRCIFSTGCLTTGCFPAWPPWFITAGPGPRQRDSAPVARASSARFSATSRSGDGASMRLGQALRRSRRRN